MHKHFIWSGTGHPAHYMMILLASWQRLRRQRRRSCARSRTCIQKSRTEHRHQPYLSAGVKATTISVTSSATAAMTGCSGNVSSVKQSRRDMLTAVINCPVAIRRRRAAVIKRGAYPVIPSFRGRWLELLTLTCRVRGSKKRMDVLKHPPARVAGGCFPA